MNKIYTYKVDGDDIIGLSNTVSEFIDSFEDKCDGAFVLTFKGKSKNKLGLLSLCFLSSDNKLLKSINGKAIDSDICKIKIIGIPTGCLFGQVSELPVKSMLKSGKVIFDKFGTLKAIQNNFDNDKSVGLLGNRTIVRSKPPIQYVKKND